MKKARLPLLMAFGLLTAAPMLSSCDKDEDVTIIQVAAGDFHGSEDCGSVGGVANPVSDDYTVRIFNTSDNTQVFVENIGSINDVFLAAQGENPHEKIAVVLQDGKFTIPATPRTYNVYESVAAANAAAATSATAGRPIDLRSTVIYTVAATGTVTKGILKMTYEITNSSLMRRRFTAGNIVAQPPINGAFDTACSFSGDRDFRYPDEGN